MSNVDQGNAWPPRGWQQLGSITQLYGQALAKDIRTAKIFGLGFNIDSEPLYQMEARFHRHKIQIDGWQYSILNESSEYPILSLTITDRHDVRKPRESFVSDIRIMGKPMEARPVLVRRAVMAAQLLIKQIQMGQVPDHERVLSIYHLHPKRSAPDDAELSQGKGEAGGSAEKKPSSRASSATTPQQ